MIRKLFYPGILILLMIFAGCRKENSKAGVHTDPKAMNIDEFASYFADMAAVNQRDSLYLIYPDIIKADSIAFIHSGKPFSIREIGDGRYQIEYSPTMKIIVTKDPQGLLSVSESYGLFAYDPGKSSLARRSGLWTDSLNDVLLSERMKDDGFFRYLEEKSRIKTSDILQIDTPVYSSPDGITGRVPVRNLTAYEVDGNDYMITMHSMTVVDGQEENQIMMVPGRNIAPNDTILVEVANSPYHVQRVNGVKFKLSQEEISEKYAPLTGNEYREYLEGS